jgi:hypothetical protein
VLFEQVLVTILSELAQDKITLMVVLVMTLYMVVLVMKVV